MKYVVATVDEIPPGERKIVDIGGRSIGVFNVQGEYFAVLNRCPHQGGPLCQGRLAGSVVSSRAGEYEYAREGEILRCPWHSWEYDVRTGQSWFDPARVRVGRYNVTVEPAPTEESAAAGPPPDAAPGLAKGPYVAETYPVSVEQRRVVVEVGA